MIDAKANSLAPELIGQAPKGRFRVSKRAVGLYFILIGLFLIYMGWTALRLNVGGSEACGNYNVSTVAHTERTFAWAFVNPTGNVSQYVGVVCGQLQKSYNLLLPS
jgi:hypothetical protein